MSAPSTATQANPPPHLHRGYPHRQDYNSSIRSGPEYHQQVSGYSIRNASSRPPHSQYNYQVHHHHSAVATNPITTTATSDPRPRTDSIQYPIASPTQPLIQDAAAMVSSQPPTTLNEPRRSRQRTPDWKNFYKNGLPKEVIVIDDDTPPPTETDEGMPEYPHVSLPSHHTTVKSTGTNGALRHADKKRKTTLDGGRVYDPIYHEQVSHAQTDHSYHDESSTTVSSGRGTATLISTASTSLGSNYGTTGVDHRQYDAVEIVGQKRKRTRRATAEEARQREIATQGDAYTTYHPPPKPPIKAKDVYVQVAHDHSNSKKQKVDDEDGHYIIVPDSDLTDRYEISKMLGQGTFGKVVQAYDRKRKTHCAIKIIRSVQKYRDASRIELRVLSTLAANDKYNRNKCIHLRDCFDYRNHICIVTDLLGQSVFDFLKSNIFTPFPNSQIQSFARQLFTSVAFLHDLNLIHTDLKPENILLVNSDYQTFTYNRHVPSSSSTTDRQARHRKVLLDTEIRLIDFGSATFDDEYHSAVVSTRHYRAPEIILGLGWSYPCDIWSIGCILVEFYTGDALFQTHDNLEHLAMMESICNSKIETKLIREVSTSARRHGGNPAAKYFIRNQRLDYPNQDTTKASRKYVKAMKHLAEIIPPTSTFQKQFLDLLRSIFLYDPKSRITAKQALQHPWFRESTIDDGSEAAKLRVDRMREKAAHAAAAGRA